LFFAAPHQANASIKEVLESRPNQFSVLVEALKVTGLMNSLSEELSSDTFKVIIEATLIFGHHGYNNEHDYILWKCP
jgi:hypothetical protein